MVGFLVAFSLMCFSTGDNIVIIVVSITWFTLCSLLLWWVSVLNEDRSFSELYQGLSSRFKDLMKGFFYRVWQPQGSNMHWHPRVNFFEDDKYSWILLYFFWQYILLCVQDIFLQYYYYVGHLGDYRVLMPGLLRKESKMKIFCTKPEGKGVIERWSAVIPPLAPAVNFLSRCILSAEVCLL